MNQRAPDVCHVLTAVLSLHLALPAVLSALTQEETNKRLGYCSRDEGVT